MFYMNHGVNGLAFSADGRILAASGSDSAVHLWDLHSGKEMAPLAGLPGNAGALVFTPDGEELVTVDVNGSRLSWKVADIRRTNAVRLPSLDDEAFARLWDELTQADVFRTYRAGRHLLAQPKRAVALMASRLRPVPPGDTARITQLVGDLGNASPGVRRKAMMELRAKHGEAAVGVLLQTPGRQQNPYNMTFDRKLADLYNTPERARDIRAVRLLGDIGTPEARQILEKLAKGAPGVPLTTEPKAALDRPAASAKQQSGGTAAADALWADLAADDAARAYRAMCGLSAAPRQAADLLGKHLRPVPVVEEKELAPLLEQLEADDFKARQRATEELEKVGEQAVPALKKALAGKPSLEARKRLEGLLERLTGQTPAPLLRSLRAVEVLEHLGTPEAKQVLLTLAGGALASALTREAKASLERLTRRPRDGRTPRPGSAGAAGGTSGPG
jgi:hypothetical protein